MDKKVNSFKNAASNALKAYKLTSGDKYCYFDIKIDNRYLKRLVLKLFYTDCPRTSENFLSLCRGFKNQNQEVATYEGTTIHRVVKNGFIQGGDLKCISNIKLTQGEINQFMGLNLQMRTITTYIIPQVYLAWLRKTNVSIATNASSILLLILFPLLIRKWLLLEK
jgi:hypothetical protein